MFIGKHIFIIFLSLFVIRNFRSVVLKVGGIALLGAILKGDETKGEISRGFPPSSPPDLYFQYFFIFIVIFHIFCVMAIFS